MVAGDELYLWAIMFPAEMIGGAGSDPITPFGREMLMGTIGRMPVMFEGGAVGEIVDVRREDDGAIAAQIKVTDPEAMALIRDRMVIAAPGEPAKVRSVRREGGDDADG